MFSPVIQLLISLFSKFPTVGPRTAARFVFYLQNLPKKDTEELIKAIQTLKDKIGLCSFCFNPFERKNSDSLCPVCSDARRDKTLLCVVEKETDLEALEKTKKYRGLYFILGGTVGRLQKKDLEELRTRELKSRILNPKKFGLNDADFKEVIIAANATPEGENTALYLQRFLAALKTRGEPVESIKITRLGRGLPLGGELEYADEETLAGALENRK